MFLQSFKIVYLNEIYKIHFKVRGALATLLPLVLQAMPKMLRMAQTAFLRLFPLESRGGGAWPPLNT